MLKEAHRNLGFLLQKINGGGGIVLWLVTYSSVTLQVLGSVPRPEVAKLVVSCECLIVFIAETCTISLYCIHTITAV